MKNPDSDRTDDLSNPVRMLPSGGVSAEIASADPARAAKSKNVETLKQADPIAGQSRLKSILCMIGAGVFLVLGTLGFLLPVIPGTPFVLLASFLLLKGSPQLHQKLRRSRFFGRILRDWEERGGIRPQDKIRAIVIVVAGAIFSFLFGPPQPLLRLIGAFFIIIGLIVILRLPPARE